MRLTTQLSFPMSTPTQVLVRASKAKRRQPIRAARDSLEYCLVLHVPELVDKNPNVLAVVDWNGDQVQPAKGKCFL